MSASLNPPTSRIRILLAEDDPDDALIVRASLAEAAPNAYAVTHESSWAEAQARLASEAFDVLLLDLSLPDAEGMDLVQEISRDAPQMAIVIMTGLDDDESAVRALQKGAQDYLVKGQAQTSVLVRTLRHAIERNRIQRELEAVRREQLELKDQFLSHVSHELRTPLTAIHQFVTLLIDELAGPLTSQQSEYLKIVFRNVIQLRDMIADLMDVTRAGSGKLRIEQAPLDIRPLISGAVTALQGTAGDKGIEITVDLPETLPRVYADDSRVQQILGNLISNAIKFTPSGGRIIARVKRLDDESEMLRISIEDTGTGISPEGTERIFERLYQEESDSTESRRGLGLGLHICKDLVDRQGGHIWVESDLGKGSVFHFTLPVFSFSGLLRPILFDEDQLRSEIVLVEVHVAPNDDSVASGIPAGVIRHINGLLRSSVTECKDLVLPRLAPSGATESFYIVVGTDTSGSGAVVHRIEQQLQRCQEISNGSLRASVASQLLEMPQFSGRPVDDVVEEISLAVWALVKDGGAL